MTIQALWRARQHVRNTSADAMRLRVICQTRRRMRKTLATVHVSCTHLLARLVAVHGLVTKHHQALKRNYGVGARAADASDDAAEVWLGMRKVASEIVANTLPFVKGCDTAAPSAGSSASWCQ